MTMNAYPVRSTQPEVQTHRVRLPGTGASAPTKERGNAITVTRTATGVYRPTFADNPGTFEGVTVGLQAATPADLKGFTVVADTWDSTNLRLDVSVFNASDAAADIAAKQYVMLDIAFAQTAVN